MVRLGTVAKCGGHLHRDMKKRPGGRFFRGVLAEAVRFELTDPCGPPVFKTGAIDHSATLPKSPL